MDYPTHEEYAAVFGEYEEDTGAETTEEPAEGAETAPAESAEAPAESPETGTEGAETAAESPETGTEGAETAAETTEQTAPSAEPAAQQSAEERHRQAAMRRAREQQEWQNRQQQAVDAVYAKLLGGQLNPFTGKPITSQAEYEAYEAMKTQQSTNSALQKAGIDPQMIQQLVQREVAPMKQQLQRAQVREAELLAADYNRKADAAISAELKTIAAQYDASIKSLADIAKMPTAARFNELVQRGNTIEESFYLANREAIDKRRAQAAFRKGTDAGVSRQHLAPAKQAQGKDPVRVPADVVRGYREAMPDMTDAEIAADYAAYLKSIK